MGVVGIPKLKFGFQKKPAVTGMLHSVPRCVENLDFLIPFPCLPVIPFCCPLPKLLLPVTGPDGCEALWKVCQFGNRTLGSPSAAGGGEPQGCIRSELVRPIKGGWRGCEMGRGDVHSPPPLFLTHQMAGKMQLTWGGRGVSWTHGHIVSCAVYHKENGTLGRPSGAVPIPPKSPPTFL